MPETMFVGRREELSRLQQSLDKANAGVSQIVFIAGEAGSGKTALAYQFLSLAEEADDKLIGVIGECDAQTGAGDAYLPFREVLTALTTGADVAKPAGTSTSPKHASRLKDFVRIASETLFLVGPDLVGLFVPGAAVATKVVGMAAFRGNLGEKLAARFGRPGGGAGATPAIDQSRIFEQYTNVLAAMARQHTLLLILDDLHWADSGSLALLFHLVRKLTASRVMIIGTYRPDVVALGRPSASPMEQGRSGQVERHPLEPILHEIQRYQGDVTIDLDAAQTAEGADLVDALVDSEPNHLDAAFRRQLLALTEGHPLFTVEMLRNMQERGDLVKDDAGYWVQSAKLDWATLPAKVEGVIEERIARLADDLRQTLNVGSVVGFDFTAQVIARVQKVEERELLRQLSDELEKRYRLVREEGEVKAGALFLSQYRFAHALFQQYLYDQLGLGTRRLLHRDVAEALEALYAGQTDSVVIQLAQHYHESGDFAKAAGYDVRAGDMSVQVSAYAEARFHYARALEMFSTLGDAVDVSRARIDVMLKFASLAFLAEPSDQFLTRMKDIEALASARLNLANMEDRARLAHLRYWLAMSHAMAGDIRATLTYLQPLLQEAQAIKDEGLYIQVTGTLGSFYSDQGRFAQAIQLLTPACTYLEQHGAWHEWQIPAMGLAMALAGAGQVTQSVALAQEISSRGQAIHDDDLVASGNAALATVRWLCGDDAGVLSAAQACIQAAEKTGSVRLTAMAYALTASAQSRLGLRELAAVSLEQGQHLTKELGGETTDADWLVAVLADISLNTGRYADAIEQAQQAITLAQRYESVWTPGIAQRVWAQALAAAATGASAASAPAASDSTRWEEVESHFAASIQALEQAGIPIETANSHEAWGHALLQHGDTQAAREHLEKAAALYEALALIQRSSEVRALIATLPTP